MAYEFYVKVKGQKQGDFKNETPREKHQGKIPGISFYYQVSSPRDSASGQASGKRTHHPVTFVKEWGASTPQFFQALATNEVLPSVLFEFVKTDKNGEEYVYHTIKLVNATVSNIKQYLTPGTASASHDVHELEEISFTFQRIEIENKDGKTMAVDDWFQRG
jgi:type VI secretion system secreted protein Hcp